MNKMSIIIDKLNNNEKVDIEILKLRGIIMEKVKNTLLELLEMQRNWKNSLKVYKTIHRKYLKRSLKIQLFQSWIQQKTTCVHD